MKFFKNLLTFIGFIIVVALGLYAYYGGFTSVVCSVETTGGELMVYEEVVGDYAKTAIPSMKKVRDDLIRHNIETTKESSVFIYTEMGTPKEEWVGKFGCVVDSKFKSAAKGLEAGYKITVLPKTKYVVATFPYKGVISAYVGAFKLRPIIDRYLSVNDLEEKEDFVTIYDKINKVIFYRVRYERD